MAKRMSDDEARAFLSEGTRTGKLATTRADGRPHLAPIWFVLDDDGTIVFNTGADTVKGKTIARDPRVSLCVDDDRPPFSFVVVEGTVECSDDLEEMLPWATRIAARYMGDDQAEAFGRRNAVAGELLVRLRPANVTKIIGLADLSV
jgi:PPOX class probable F420-dependent enzyme